MTIDISLSGVAMKHMEKTAMEVHRRQHRHVVALLAAVAALVLGMAGPAAAQLNFGSGTHGSFPPDPSGGVPSGTRWVVWNVKLGTVRYCSNYAFGTGIDACDSGAPVNLMAQIPNIPSGGLTTGVYEFTSVNLAPIGITRTLVVVGTSPNVPITILATGDITFPGSGSFLTELNLQGLQAANPGGNQTGFSAAGGRSGPGGFEGGASGNGGATPSNGNTGFGPNGGAGGQAGSTQAAAAGLVAGAGPVNPSLTPLTGGSGGGGAAGAAAGAFGCANNTVGYGGGPGGGGGGAILLAAAGTVTIGTNVQLKLFGGQGSVNVDCGSLIGGGGAGGNVRIVAQQFTGAGSIDVSGAVNGNGTLKASGGFVRIEASSNTFTGGITGAAGGSFVSFPTAPIPATQPLLRITAVGGSGAPANPNATLASPDITFPAPISAPVTVDLAANNVPTGTTITVKVVPAVGSPTTATSSALNGTTASSTAQATVTLPPGAGIITATATFTAGGQSAALLPSALPLIDGERPQVVEVTAGVDGASHTFLVAKSGARFELSRGLR